MDSDELSQKNYTRLLLSPYLCIHNACMKDTNMSLSTYIEHDYVSHQFLTDNQHSHSTIDLHAKACSKKAIQMTNHDSTVFE